MPYERSKVEQQFVYCISFVFDKNSFFAAKSIGSLSLCVKNIMLE